MRKDFALQSELNRFIERASQHGLLMRWIKKSSFSSYLEKPPKFIYFEIAMDTHKFAQLFFFLFVLISTSSFIVERIVYKKVRANGASRWWRYMEVLIDPNRYFLLNDLAY